MNPVCLFKQVIRGREAVLPVIRDVVRDDGGDTRVLVQCWGGQSVGLKSRCEANPVLEDHEKLRC